MAKSTALLSLVLVWVLCAGTAFGAEGGYPMPEYLDNVSNIDPRDGSALDFLEDTDRGDYFVLAGAAYDTGDYENSARLYLARLRDNYDDIALYNLACCYSLMGDTELATRAVKHLAINGFAMAELVANDPDLEAIRGTAAFKEAAAKIAENAEAQGNNAENRRYFELTSLAPGTVILPDDYDPNVAYPVVVALHGAAHTPDRVLELRDMLEGTGFIFVALRAQNPVLWEGQVGYNWVFYGVEDEDIVRRAAEMSEQYILGAVAEIKAQYKTSGVYLAGFSDGGAMAYITGIRNPEAFDGIIPIGGYLPEQLLGEEAVTAGNGARIFMIHGTADTSVAYEGAEAALATFREAGYDAELFTHDGGHILHDEGMKTAQEWLGF